MSAGAGLEKKDFPHRTMDEWQLRHVWQNRQPPRRLVPLSEPLSVLMKRRLARRVRQVGRLSAAWDECIPAYIREHTALVSYVRGVLTVAVDSAAHRYQLQTLLRDGLQEAIRERAGGPLNRIRLVPGQFDYLEMPDRRAPQA